jgi:hypothetical protein
MVESQMSYLEPWAHKSEAPYVRGRVEEGFPRTNFVNQTYPVRIRNARPQQDLFHLDTHGFAFYEAGELNNEIVDAIRTRRKCLVEEKYYPEYATWSNTKQERRKSSSSITPTADEILRLHRMKIQTAENSRQHW